MSQFSITVEIPEGITDPQQVAGALALAVGRTLLGSESTPEALPSATDSPLESETAPNASTYVGATGPATVLELLGEVAPSTRLALREIAEATLGSGSIHSVELRDRLGLGSPSALAGVLTSLGFAEKRTGLPKPYTQKWREYDGAWGNQYAMEPEVARTMLDLINADGSVKAP